MTQVIVRYHPQPEIPRPEPPGFSSRAHWGERMNDPGAREAVVRSAASTALGDDGTLRLVDWLRETMRTM